MNYSTGEEILHRDLIHWDGGPGSAVAPGYFTVDTVYEDEGEIALTDRDTVDVGDIRLVRRAGDIRVGDKVLVRHATSNNGTSRYPTFDGWTGEITGRGTQSNHWEIRGGPRGNVIYLDTESFDVTLPIDDIPTSMVEITVDIQSSIYCHCSSPTVEKRYMTYTSFDFCTTCKKEKI